MTKYKIRKRSEMHEIEMMYKRPLLDEMPIIKNSFDVDQVIRKIVDFDRIDYCEVFIVLYLTNNNSILGFSEVGMGSATSVMIDAKDLITNALLTRAQGLVISHNHPSGSLKPSQSDKDISARINVISSLFNIKLLDSLIITRESYYSFADSGLLLKPDNTLPF